MAIATVDPDSRPRLEAIQLIGKALAARHGADLLGILL